MRWMHDVFGNSVAQLNLASTTPIADRQHVASRAPRLTGRYFQCAGSTVYPFIYSVTTATISAHLSTGTIRPNGLVAWAKRAGRFMSTTICCRT